MAALEAAQVVGVPAAGTGMADASLLFWRRAAGSIVDERDGSGTSLIRPRGLGEPRRPTRPTIQPYGIELPADTEATYSNFAIINHSPSGIVIDFARLLPNVPTAKVHARIVMTPLNAKLLLRALQDNLNRYGGAGRRGARAQRRRL